MLWEHRPLVIVFTAFFSSSKDLFTTPHLLLIWWGYNVALYLYSNGTFVHYLINV